MMCASDETSQFTKKEGNKSWHKTKETSLGSPFLALASLEKEEEEEEEEEKDGNQPTARIQAFLINSEERQKKTHTHTAILRSRRTDAPPLSPPKIVQISSFFS